MSVLGRAFGTRTQGAVKVIMLYHQI